MQLFRDDDQAYVRWRAANPEGFVVNSYREPSAKYLMLHRATCGHIASHKSEPWHWTRDWVKVCAPGRDELELWARRDLGGAVKECLHCIR
jgi:hypothetical protein